MKNLTLKLFFATRLRPWWLRPYSSTGYKLCIRNRVFFLELRYYPDSIEIEHLYIEPRYRRRGYGTAIVKVLKSIATAEKIDVAVPVVLTSAEPFWIKLGFSGPYYRTRWSPP